MLETTHDGRAPDAKLSVPKEHFARTEAALGYGSWLAATEFGVVNAGYAPLLSYFDVFDGIADFRIFDKLHGVWTWRTALAERPSVRAAVVVKYAARLRAFFGGARFWIFKLSAECHRVKIGLGRETQIDNRFDREGTMQFMMSMYEPAGDFERRSEDEMYWPAWYAYSTALREAGILVGGNALQTPETSAMVSIKAGRVQIEDGPFVEGRDQLGGYYIIEVNGLEEAVSWAARAPCAATGRVEVRPVLAM